MSCMWSDIHFHPLYHAVVDCGTPGAVANSNYNLTGTTFGAIVSYECMDGYSLVGVTERVCQENGKWSGEEPSCICECMHFT